MRRTPLVTLAIAVLAIAVARPGEAAVSVGLHFNGGYDRYAMGDWADLMTGLRVPRDFFGTVDAGHTFGVGPEILWGDHLVVAGAYERMSPAERRGPLDTSLRLPTNALTLTLRLERRAGAAFRYGIGGGAGYYQAGDEVEFRPFAENISGNGVGFHGVGIVERRVRSSTFVTLQAGYRWARVKVDGINGRPPTRFVSGVGLQPLDVDLDYSGLLTRIGLLFHTPLR